MFTVGSPPAHLLLRSNLVSLLRLRQIVSTPVNAACGEAHCHCKEGYISLSLTYHPVLLLTLVRTIAATALPRPTASAEAVFIRETEAGLFSCEIVYICESEVKYCDEKTNIYNASLFVTLRKETDEKLSAVEMLATLRVLQEQLSPSLVRAGSENLLRKLLSISTCGQIN